MFHTWSVNYTTIGICINQRGISHFTLEIKIYICQVRLTSL